MQIINIIHNNWKENNNLISQNAVLKRIRGAIRNNNYVIWINYTKIHKGKIKIGCYTDFISAKCNI